MSYQSALIIVSGLPGSGKSTLSEKLADRLHVPILSVDPIESAIVKAGISPSEKTGLAAYMVAEALVDAQLCLNQTVIVDAVSAEVEPKNMWRTVAKRHNTHLIIIECFLDDESLHKQRLHSRPKKLDGIPIVHWKDVEVRRKNYVPWHEPALQINTANSEAENLRKALNYIKSILS